MSKAKLTFLGTGTSQGVPMIGCGCEVCNSADPRDKRLRSSAFIQYEGLKILASIVPMVTHLDHSEHSVKVLVTEQGVADLRGKSPRQRAQEIINNCVAPEYREMLQDYLKYAKHGQTQHNLSLAFAMHEEFLKSGDMRNTKWENYLR